MHTEKAVRPRGKHTPAKIVRRLRKAIFTYARRHDGASDAHILLMALALWERAVEERKVDAVAMGLYGMNCLFDQAPEDSGRIATRLERNGEGGWRVALESADKKTPPDREGGESVEEDLGMVQ